MLAGRDLGPKPSPRDTLAQRYLGRMVINWGSGKQLIRRSATLALVSLTPTRSSFRYVIRSRHHHQ